MEESQPSTIDYYHQNMHELQIDILNRHYPVNLDYDDEPFCMVCGRLKSDVPEMHVEHPDNDGESTGDEGGWDKYYKYRDHLEEGRRLWVVCIRDHYLLHKRRGDKHGERLKRRHHWLSEYDDKDAGFLIRQKLKEFELPLKELRDK
jgi:hypothetical protein